MEHNALIEIAEIISGGDEAVLADVTVCVKDPAAYFEAHREQFLQRVILSAEDPALICWLGLADALEAREHVCERDWEDEKEDFLYFLGKLTGMKRFGLELQPDWLDEEGGISQWAAILDEKWAATQCCAACMDIDNDSYVLFPCAISDLARLRALAEEAGQRIELAEKM